MATLNKAQYEGLVSRSCNALASKALKAQDHKLDGFAEACYDDNSYEELVAALDFEADAIDCKAWGITDQEWHDSIKQALELSMFWYENQNATG